MDFSLFDFSMGVSAALAGLGLFVLSRSFFRVDEGHVAAITRFGKALKDSHGALRIYRSGMHRKRPWDRAVTFSTMERVIDLTGEEGGHLAMAADGTVLRLDSRIRFFPKQQEFYNYLFAVNNPMAHIKDMFSCILRNEIANFGKGPDGDDFLGAFYAIRRNRESLNQRVDTACASRLEKSCGVQFCGVDLIDIVPPHELESALNGIQTARTEAATLYAKAEADSRQKIAAARENVEIARLRAESTVTELVTLSQSIEKAMRQGTIESFLNHRKTELLGDSKMLFLQKEI